MAGQLCVGLGDRDSLWLDPLFEKSVFWCSGSHSLLLLLT